MSNRHICKARRTNDGGWVEGFYVMHSTSIEYPYSYTNGKHCIQTVPHNIQYEVAPETICQHTGLPDKNGKKIFEGDIVKEENAIGTVKFGKYGNGFHYGFYIEWHNCPLLRTELAYWNSRVEVNGNIFDNAEFSGRQQS